MVPFAFWSWCVLEDIHMNIPECYHKKCFQNCNIKSQVDEVDIVDKQAIMKVHPMRTLGVEAILDLPAPPQQASCLENISQIELVSPKPCPARSNPKSAGRLFESSSEETDLADELLIGFEEGVLWLFVQLHPRCAHQGF